MQKRPATLTAIERTVAKHIIRDAVRQVHKARGGFPRPVAYELDPWCDTLLDAIGQHRAVLAYWSQVVQLPPPRRPHRPAYVAAIDAPKRISTPELRRHAFAIYASAMAYHGPDAAFDAAVNETLRREPGWGLPAAVAHTKQFVVPAYQRAFSGGSGRR